MGLPEFWFVVIAVLFGGYFVLEGFDFGVGMLMPFIGRGHESGDTRRRVLLNTIGPVWDANEVWLLTAGGAMFAAFGGWYATLFSAMYFPLLLILVGLIVRVVSIEWRGKINDPRWRMWCDVGIGLGSWIPALLWGVAFANVVRGLPIDAEHQFTGSFFTLLNPYALLGGLTTLLVFATHGAVFLALKTTGVIRDDAARYAVRLSMAMLVVAGVFLLWTQLAYGKDWTWGPVVIAALAAVGAVAATLRRAEGLAFAATTIAIIGTVITLFGSLYPNVLPSTTNPAYNLTVENTSSSHYTLTIMTWAACFITPVVIAYQGWSYWVFRQRISIEQIPPSIGLPSLRA
ncbi:cytochrome d ubiquinol oxidase subunit II [Gordonia sp. TBRC 11910]|uniref:Cytochrome d ubiquinol oxidase subunit II n=1 Tax=Gordonia asplenii TaxID=2725283 RepID=A0A848L1T7_9ACTN|nr:cytochrome d ubiquinol oxidase subunit II [Gordonia asplenii]NMO04427.1 cytochrome d ubiquinol oxidase subunit II [Gordonia asplenii]